MGGEGYNEIRFEDLKDKEQVYFHAQRNMDCRVLNDSMETIIGNRNQTIGQEDQDGNKSGDQREMVYGSKNLDVKTDQVEKIEGDYKLTVGNGDDEDGGHLHVVVEKKECKSVGDDGLHLSVSGDMNEKIGGTVSQSVGGDVQESFGGNWAAEAGQTVYLKGGMSVVIESDLQITLVVGDSYVSITPIGVDISGPLVNINSGGATGEGDPPEPSDPDEAEEADPTAPDPADNSVSGQKCATTTPAARAIPARADSRHAVLHPHVLVACGIEDERGEGRVLFLLGTTWFVFLKAVFLSKYNNNLVHTNLQPLLQSDFGRDDCSLPTGKATFQQVLIVPVYHNRQLSHIEGVSRASRATTASGVPRQPLPNPIIPGRLVRFRHPHARISWESAGIAEKTTFASWSQPKLTPQQPCLADHRRGRWRRGDGWRGWFWNGPGGGMGAMV